jgi:hypothetical protein
MPRHHDVIVLGPVASGKGWMVNVIAESSFAGDVSMNSMSGASRNPTADRYILMYREGAAESIRQRNWVQDMAVSYAEAEWADAWNRSVKHADGTPSIIVDYRDAVTDLPAVIERLALFLDVPPWDYTGPLFDGDDR